MNTFLNILRQENALEFLTGRAHKIVTTFKTDGLYDWVAAFGAPTTGVTWGRNYNLKDGEVILEDFTNAMKDRYKALERVEHELLKKTIRELLTINSVTNMTDCKPELRRLVCWLAFPDLDANDPAMTYNLYLRQTNRMATGVSDGYWSKKFLDRAVEIVKPNATLDNVSETEALYDFSIAVMGDVFRIRQRIRKEPDLKYMVLNPEEPIKTILSLGYTHDDILASMLAGEDRGLADEDTVSANIEICKSNAAYIHSVANGDNLRVAISAFAQRMVDEYMSGRATDTYNLFQDTGLRYAIAALAPNEKEMQAAIDHLTNHDGDYAFSDLFRMVTRLRRDYVTHTTIDVIRWVFRHRQWWGGYTDIESSSGEVVNLHNHTLIDNILSGNSDLRGLEPKDKPSVLEFLFRTPLVNYADKTINTRITFPPSQLILDDFKVVENGEELSFKFIPDSVSLSSEGQTMGHCVGGYAQRLGVDAMVYHVSSSVNRHGYTMHITRENKDKPFIVTEMRGRFNANLPEATYPAIEKHLANAQTVLA